MVNLISLNPFRLLGLATFVILMTWFPLPSFGQSSAALELPQENTWLAICQITDPILAQYENHKDAAKYEELVKEYKDAATPFTEQDLVSLVVHAPMMEAKSISQQRAAAELAAIRLAKMCTEGRSFRR